VTSVFPLQITFKMFKIENGIKKKLLQLPKLNYCDLRRTSGIVPILSEFLTSLEPFGNLIFNCPASPGVYYVKGFPMSAFTAAPLIPVGYYFMVVEVFDDNDRKKSQLVAKFLTENHRE
jgi:Protein of unknown function (DUF1091)